MKSDFFIDVNIEQENISYIKSSLEVYNHCSPEAYYVYVSLINSNPDRFSPNFQFFYASMGQSKARKGIQELQDLGLLDIRKINHRKHVWTIKYTFSDERAKKYAVPDQVVKKRQIKAQEREDVEEKINQIDIEIAALRMILETTFGSEYEAVQLEIIRLEQEKKGLKI